MSADHRTEDRFLWAVSRFSDTDQTSDRGHTPPFSQTLSTGLPSFSPGEQLRSAPMAPKRSASEAALSPPSEDDGSDKTDTDKSPGREEDSPPSPVPRENPLNLVGPLPSLVVLDLDKTVSRRSSLDQSID